MGKEVNVLRVSMVCLVLVAVLLLLAVVALGVGSAGYSLQQIIQALFYDERGPVRVVVYNLRLPRLIMAVEVGACLAVAGALLQAVMRNPLADPGIIGVSAGAATAATTILLLFPTLVSSVPLFAFGGAALACVLIYLLAWRDGIDTVQNNFVRCCDKLRFWERINSFLQLLNSDNSFQCFIFYERQSFGTFLGSCLYHYGVCFYWSCFRRMLYKKMPTFCIWVTKWLKAWE